MEYSAKALTAKLGKIFSKTAIQKPSALGRATKLDAVNAAPDVVSLEYLGLMVVLEGEFGDTPGAEALLEDRSSTLIADGIARLVIGILFPSELRIKSSDDLDNSLMKTIAKVKIFSEIEAKAWHELDLEAFPEVLREAYHSLVNEDLVAECVQLIDDGIETFVQGIKDVPGLRDKVKDVMASPKGIHSS
nr:hypothetical protein [Candidatus Sigynarchaeota archaeon]